MFSTALDKYGDLSAMGFKQQGTWEHISYTQYYLLARKAAKGFLKVRELPKAWTLPSQPCLQFWPSQTSFRCPTGQALRKDHCKIILVIELMVHSGLGPRVYVQWTLTMCQDVARTSYLLSRSRGAGKPGALR